MAKKKKGGKKKEKVAKVVDPKVQQEIDARVEATRLKHEVLVEEMKFNDYQQQREKLNYFWIVEKKNLEDAKAELRNKERELQDLEEKHQVEIKVYKQRVKHLLYEHTNEITQLKAAAESSLKMSQDNHRAEESEIKKDRRNLKVGLKAIELSHEDYLNSLKQSQDKAITQLRQLFERKQKELQDKYDKKMSMVRDELEAKAKADYERIQEQKNRHISELMRSNEKAFGEIKNYYTDITHNNLDLIKSLKDEVADMKKQEGDSEKLMYEISQENRKLSEPLKEATQDVDRLHKEKEEYMQSKEELRATKADLLVVDEELQALTWEHEVLSQRFDQVKTERDELYNKFQTTIYSVQQRSGFKNLLLEKKVEALNEALEKKYAQLQEVLGNANLDSSAVGGAVAKKADDLVDAKNAQVAELQMELERVTRAHNEMLRRYEHRLVEASIPAEELGFRPQFFRMPAKSQQPAP